MTSLFEVNKENVHDLSKKFENKMEGATVKIVSSAKDRNRIQIADIEVSAPQIPLYCQSWRKTSTLEKRI